MTSLQFAEFNDFSGGMNKANTLDAIADNEVAHMQDMIPGAFGATAARGTLETGKSTAGGNTLSSYSGVSEPHGIFSTQSPDGIQRIGFCATTGGGATVLGCFADDLASSTNYETLHTAFALKGRQPVVYSSPRVGGGVVIGISDGYEAAHTNRNLFVWNGANFSDYSTGTVSLTTGSRTATGASTVWGTFAGPGMYLFLNGAFVGMVTSVASNTSLTLDRPSPYTVAGGVYQLKSFRGLNLRLGGGLITTFTDSAVVVGADTSFIGQGLNSAGHTYTLFRASDHAYIGALSSVSTDTGLTLGGNALVALTNEAWYAVQTDLVNAGWEGSLTALNSPGFLSTTYAGLQWYANAGFADKGFGAYQDSVWYSEEGQPDVLNMAPNGSGNRVQVQNINNNPNTGIRGFLGTANGLLTCKDRETHVILGDNPDNFSNQKIIDDGCLGAGTVQSYQGAAVWAGWDGIWLWDGAAPVNLTLARLGDWYKSTIVGFRENNARAWSFMYRDYYVLYVEQLARPVTSWLGTRNVSTHQPLFDTTSNLMLVIHVPSRAASILRAVDVLGAVKYSGASVGEQVFGIVPLYGGGPSNNASVVMGLARLNALFDGIQVGSVLNNPVFKDPTTGNWFAENVTYPRPYLQTKAYDLGTPLIKKAWRSLLTHYASNNAVVGVVPLIDPDLTAAGTPLVDLPAATTLTVKRQKFVRRSRKISFQLFVNPDAGTLTSFAIKSIGLLYKNLPTGRV